MVKIVKANIRLYKSESSRKTSFTSGYRPIFSFENQEMKTSGQIILINKKEFSPGEEDEVQIHFLSQFLGDTFGEGTRFTFSEGAVPLGDGIVREIL